MNRTGPSKAALARARDRHIHHRAVDAEHMLAREPFLRRPSWHHSASATSAEALLAMLGARCCKQAHQLAITLGVDVDGPEVAPWWALLLAADDADTSPTLPYYLCSLTRQAARAIIAVRHSRYTRAARRLLENHPELLDSPVDVGERALDEGARAARFLAIMESYLQPQTDPMARASLHIDKGPTLPDASSTTLATHAKHYLTSYPYMDGRLVGWLDRLAPRATGSAACQLIGANADREPWAPLRAIGEELLEVDTCPRWLYPVRSTSGTHAMPGPRPKGRPAWT